MKDSIDLNSAIREMENMLVVEEQNNKYISAEALRYAIGKLSEYKREIRKNRIVSDGDEREKTKC